MHIKTDCRKQLGQNFGKRFLCYHSSILPPSPPPPLHSIVFPPPPIPSHLYCFSSSCFNCIVFDPSSCYSTETLVVNKCMHFNCKSLFAGIAFVFVSKSIVNRGEWLWNSSKFFVVCFCSLFWPWPCTKHNSWLRTEELTNRNVLVT